MPLARRNSSVAGSVTDGQEVNNVDRDRVEELGTGSSTATLAERRTNAPNRRKSVDRWWKIRIGSGIIRDIKARTPFYLSDWTDAWNYRVIPSTLVSFNMFD